MKRLFLQKVSGMLTLAGLMAFLLTGTPVAAAEVTPNSTIEIALELQLVPVADLPKIDRRADPHTTFTNYDQLWPDGVMNTVYDAINAHRAAEGWDEMLLDMTSADAHRIEFGLPTATDARAPHKLHTEVASGESLPWAHKVPKRV